jgi:hypothetical protein
MQPAHICTDCREGRLIETSYHTKLCLFCGLERRSSFSTSNMMYASPPPRELPPTYNRSTRFKELLHKILGIESGPKVTDPIWMFLKQLSPFQSPQDIFHNLKKSSLTNKHYNSVHIFTKIFCPTFASPSLPTNIIHIIALLCQRFDDILLMWNQSTCPTFFSYNYLLEVFLTEHDMTQFLPFLKKLQCPKRREKYKNKVLAVQHVGISPGLHVVKSNEPPILRVGKL